MPLDVLEKLNEAKQNVSSDEQLTQNLDAIIEKAKSSSESMDALRGIVDGLTAGGNNLSDSLQKVCYYFEKFEERSNAAKISAFGLDDAYNKMGKSAPSHFGKIISSLEEIQSIQNDLSRGASLPIVNQVSVLTKEITKLRNALKDMPKMPTGGAIPMGKYATGGEIPGNSTSGDKVPIMVNSGEYVLNKAQMMKIGRMLGGKSPKQVFQEASSRSSLRGRMKDGVQAFASGGIVDSLHTFINRLPNSDPRRNRFNKLLQVMRDNAISNADVAARIPSGMNFASLSEGDINNLITSFKQILRRNINIDPMSNVNSSDDSKVGRMFGDAQTAMKRTMLGMTNPADRQNQARKIREAGSIQRQVNRIGKSGTREDKEKLEQLNRKFGIFDSSDIEGLSPDDFKEYSAGLQEIKDHVDAVTDEVSKLEEEFDSTSKSITTMFKEWGIGNVVMVAGIVLMAQKAKEIAEGIQKWIGEIVQLNVETQKLQQNMNALGGSINMDAMRDGLNLTRKEALALGEAYKTIGLNAVNSMENVSTIAANLKNAFGQIDVSMLKEAVNLIKDLPNEQVEVLITGKGSFDDKANLLTNLMKDGKLETAIDLMANGTFGDVDGSVKISPKDKALIETQNRTNKILEDIKFGLYDWMPDGLGKLAIVSTGFAQFLTNAIQTYMIGRGIWISTKKIASAAGFGFINVRDSGLNSLGGGGSNGLSNIITSSIGRVISGAIIGFAVGEVVGSLFEAWGNKLSNDIKKTRDYELQAKAVENKQKYGHTQGNILDYFKKEQDAKKWERAGGGAKTGAVIGGTIAGIIAGLALIGTGVGAPAGLAIMGASALGGAALGGAAGGAVGYGAGALEGVGNPFEDAIDSKNNLDKAFYKDVISSIERSNQILYGDKNGKKQLKELISLNKYSKKMSNILSKRFNSYQHESINADVAGLRIMSQVGGSDANYDQKLQRALQDRIRLGRQESEMMSNTILQVLKDKNVSSEGKVVAINNFLNQQHQFISDFKEGIDNILKMLFQSPEMLKRKFELEISNMQIDFGNKSFMDTSLSKLSSNFEKSSKNMQEASNKFAIVSENLKTMDMNFDGVIKQAKSQQNEVMKQSGLDENSAKKLVDKYQEEANKMMGNGGGDVAVAVELLKEMASKAKTQEEIMSNLPTTKDTLKMSEEFFTKNGEHKKVAEAKKMYNQLEDIEKVLSDPHSSEEDRKKAVEQYKALINVGITNLHDSQLKMLAGLKEKFPKIDQAKLILGFQKIITNAGNSKTMIAEKTRDVWKEFISIMESESQNMGKQIEAAFNSGTITFTKALINALERQKKYDNISNAVQAGAAAQEAALVKVNQLGEALQNGEKIAEKSGIVLNGGRDERGNFQKGINESYEDRVRSQENGKEKLKQEEKNGVKAYREKSVKRAELIRQAAMTKDAKQRAKLIAQIEILSRELQNKENSNEAVKKWLKEGSGEAFKISLGSVIGPLEKLMNGQTEYKEAVIKSFEEIGNSILNALEDGIVRLAKAITDASASKADYHKKFGNLDEATLESRKSIEDSYVAQQEGIKKLEEAQRIAHENNLKNLQDRMREANGDQEKIRVAQIEYAKTEADIIKNKFEGMKKLVQETVDKISAYISVKAERLGRIEESLNIEKDFANQIGAPFEYIVELEKASVQMAREKVKLAEEELKFIEEAGIEGEVREKAKLKLQKAQAEELKATFGAQRDSIDKMLGKVMGTFQEIGGIFGPNSARMMAKKYGQGYMMNEAGLAVRAGQWTGGFNGRTGYTAHNALPPRFASGGENHGKLNGSSKVGDKNWVLANAGEWFLTPEQMNILKLATGSKSREEVFAFANKTQQEAQHYLENKENSNEIQRFATGGKTDKKDPLYYSALEASRRAQRYSKADLTRYFDEKGNWKVQSIRQHGATPNKHYAGAYDISIDDALRHKHRTRFQEDVYDEDAEKAKIVKHNAEIDEIRNNDVVDATPGALQHQKFQESTFGKGNSGSQSGKPTTYTPYRIQQGNGGKAPTKEDTLKAGDRALRGGVGNMNPEEESDKLEKISKDVEEILKILKNEIDTVDESTTSKKSPKDEKPSDGNLYIHAAKSEQTGHLVGVSQTPQIQSLPKEQQTQGNFVVANNAPASKKSAQPELKLGLGSLDSIFSPVLTGFLGKIQNPADIKTGIGPVDSVINPIIASILGQSTTNQQGDVKQEPVNGQGKGDAKSEGTEDVGTEIKKLLGEIAPDGNTIRDVENRNALAKFMSNPCKKKENAIKIQKDILDTVREIRDLLRGTGSGRGGSNDKFSPPHYSATQIKPEKISPNAIGGMAYFGSQGKGSFLRNIKAGAINGWRKLKSGASKVWTAARKWTGEKWEAVKNSKFGRAVKERWDGAKAKAKDLWEGAKSRASKIWDGAKTKIRTGMQRGREWFNEKVFGKVSQKRLHELQKEAYAKTGKRPSIKSIKQSLADKSVVGRWQKAYQSELKGNKPSGNDIVSRIARLAGKGKKAYDSTVTRVKSAVTKARDYLTPKAEAVKTKATELWSGAKEKVPKLWEGAKGKVSEFLGGAKSRASKLWEGAKSRITNSQVGQRVSGWLGNAKKVFNSKLDLARTGFEVGMSGGKANRADSFLERASITAGNKFRTTKEKFGEIRDSIRTSVRNTRDTFMKGYGNLPNNTLHSRVQGAMKGIKDVVIGAKNNLVDGYRRGGGTGFNAEVGKFIRTRVDNARSRFQKGYNNSNAKLAGPSAQFGQMYRNFREGFNRTNGGNSYNGARANETSLSYKVGDGVRSFMDGYKNVEGANGWVSRAGKLTRGLTDLPGNIKAGYQGTKTDGFGAKVGKATKSAVDWGVNAKNNLVGGYKGTPGANGKLAELGKITRSTVDFGVRTGHNFMEGLGGGGKGASGWTGRQVGKARDFVKNAPAQKVMGGAMMAQGMIGLFDSVNQLNNIKGDDIQLEAKRREALIQAGQSAGSMLFGANTFGMKPGGKMGIGGKAGLFMMAASSLPGLFATKKVVDPETGEEKNVWDSYAASYHAENLANTGMMLHPGLMKGNVNPKMFGWGMALQAGGAGLNLLANQMREGAAKNRVSAGGDLLSSAGGFMGDVGMTMATGGVNKIVEGVFDVGRKAFTEEGRRRAGNVGGTMEVFDTVTKLGGTQTIFKGLGSIYDLATGSKKGRDYMDIGAAVSEIDNAVETGKALDAHLGRGLTGKDAERYAQLKARQDALRREHTSFGRSIGQVTFGGLWGRKDEDILAEMNANELEMTRLQAQARENRKAEFFAGRRETAKKAVGYADSTLGAFGSLKETLSAELKKGDDMSVKFTGGAEGKAKKAEEARKATEAEIAKKKEKLKGLEGDENKEERIRLEQEIKGLEGTLAQQVKDEQGAKAGVDAEKERGDLFKTVRNGMAGDLKGQLAEVEKVEAQIKTLRDQLAKSSESGSGISEDERKKLQQQLAAAEKQAKQQQDAVKATSAQLVQFDEAWNKGQLTADMLKQLAAGKDVSLLAEQPVQQGQLTPEQQAQQQAAVQGQQPGGMQAPWMVASSTPISKEAVSIMQRREAAGQKMFGEAGSVDGQSAGGGGGKQQIEVTVNVKFNHAAFAAETVKVVTSGDVAQQITNRGMTSNG